MLILPHLIWMLLRSLLLWYQHLININKIILITFQGKVLLSHLKDGKPRHQKKPNPKPKKKKKSKARFVFSAVFKSTHVFPERSKSSWKNEFPCRRSDNGVSFRAVITPQKCGKQREPAALVQSSQSTNFQVPTDFEQRPSRCLPRQSSSAADQAGCHG